MRAATMVDDHVWPEDGPAMVVSEDSHPGPMVAAVPFVVAVSALVAVAFLAGVLG